MTHMKADDLFRQIQGQGAEEAWLKKRWAEAVLQEEARRQDIHDQNGKIVWNPPVWFVVLILAAFFGALLWWWLS